MAGLAGQLVCPMHCDMDKQAGWSETMPWWDIYFNELYLRMFETIQTPERTAREVAGDMTMLDLEPGARILDLCCGQGRHAVPLSQAGYHLTGLDRSVYLLGQAKLAANAAGVNVQWVRAVSYTHLRAHETNCNISYDVF